MKPDRLGLSERLVSGMVVVIVLAATSRVLFELSRPMLPSLGFAALLVAVAWFSLSRPS